MKRLLAVLGMLVIAAGVAPTPTPAYFFSSTSQASLATIPASSVTTTGPVAGTYNTKYASALLSGLLGGTVYVGVGTVQGTWQSAPASATATLPLVIGNGTCTIN